MPTLYTYPAGSLLPTPSPLRHLVRFKRTCLPWVAPNAMRMHLPKITWPKFLAYPVAPAPPPFGRSLLPTLSSAATKTCKARARVHCVGRHFPGTHHSHRAFHGPAAQYGKPLMPGSHIPSRVHTRTHARKARPSKPAMLNLTKSPSYLCLPCTFPPARRFRPLGLWQPSLGGTPQ